MSKDENESDVLIIGAGPTGLYAALLLSQMNISVCIIDKKSAADGCTSNPAFLWSPRTLQLLHAFDLANPLIERGLKIWRFDSFVNKGHGNSAATVDHQKHNVWENEATVFNSCLSCECDQVCQALLDALNQRGIRVRYNHELIDLEDEILSAPTGHSPAAETKYINASIRVLDNQIIYWKSRIVLGADGINSFVRKKLGIPFQGKNSSKVFYTLEASVATNFLGARSVSTVTKGRNSLLLLARKEKDVVIMFEHKPTWSKLSIDDDVPLALAQKHLRSIMEPFQLEFLQVHGYHRWTADERYCEEYSVDRRYFLAGGAAQWLGPSGIITANLGLEQVHNLCWKLFLCLRHQASPQLLDTYEPECRTKFNDASNASTTWLQLISPEEPANSFGSNSAVNYELGYQLSRNKHSLVGETPYHSNMINFGTTSTLSLAASTIDPVKMAASLSRNAQMQIHQGLPGTLAPNAKLKPYTLFNLLVTQTKDEERHSPTPLTNSSDITNGGQAQGSSDNRQPRATNQRRWRMRSNSATNLRSVGWLAPIFSSMTRRSSTNDNEVARSDSQQSASSAESRPNKAAAAAHSYLDRWRKIKTNHFHLLDRMIQSAAPGSFSILVFCGSLDDRENLAWVQKFRRFLEEPRSFVLRYEKLGPQYPFFFPSDCPSSPQSIPSPHSPWANDTAGYDFRLSIASSSHPSSSSASITISTYRQSRISSAPNSPLITGRPSMDQLQLPSTASSSSSSSYSTRAPHRKNSSSSASVFVPPPSPSQFSLFSFIYITSATRHEAARFLNTTKPAIVYATFPLGLDKVYLDHDHQSHSAYDIKHPSVVVVRPDGYIGITARLDLEHELEALNTYFDAFLQPPIDLTSAASMAADYYYDL